ncbi:predicted protein [Lichtheimia corymbifera JMRC:FSU:9682]|uniref:Uncharacterized protein n=1 Tax=Lichtheimia corymbifera JMRC:FSU:9682 TaxID=1263082 RepID=A0A068S4Y9_9FUNG|nr:predicted protein [Lichtheimia corymbifera JMRC:FSU:9682]
MSNTIDAVIGGESATWPPNYSNYTDLEGDDILHALENESKSKRAPGSYRAFISKLLRQMRSHQSAQSEQDKRIKSLKLDIAALTEYLGNARKNYDELAQFLQDERILRKEKEAKVNELQEALKKEKERAIPSSPAQAAVSSPSSQHHNRPPSSSPFQQQQQQQQPTTPVSHQPSPITSPHVQHPNTPANVTEQSIAASTAALRARITDLERQLMRSAKGRQAMETEMLNQVRQGSELRAQVQELKTELARVNALVQSKEQTNVQLRSDLERTQQAFGAWMHQFSANNPQLSQLLVQQQQRPNTQQQQQPISPTHNITPQQQLSMAIPHSSPPMTMAPSAVTNIPQQQQQQPSSAVYSNPAAPNFRLALPERRVQYDQHHHPQQHH